MKKSDSDGGRFPINRIILVIAILMVALIGQRYYCIRMRLAGVPQILLPSKIYYVITDTNLCPTCASGSWFIKNYQKCKVEETVLVLPDKEMWSDVDVENFRGAFGISKDQEIRRIDEETRRWFSWLSSCRDEREQLVFLVRTDRQRKIKEISYLSRGKK